MEKCTPRGSEIADTAGPPPGDSYGKELDRNGEQTGVCSEQPPPRFKHKNWNSEYLHKTDNAQKCLESIKEIERQRVMQERLDDQYNRLVELFIDDMNKFYKPLTGCKVSKKGLKHTTKPWWRVELTELWKLLKECERKYTRHKRYAPGFNLCRAKFIEAQRNFDKNVKRSKRAYLGRRVLEIESSNTDNPRAFWEFIQGLSPRKIACIPCEVVLDWVQVTDPTRVLQHWSNEFHSLLTSPTPTEDQAQHLRHIQESNRRELEMIISPENEGMNDDFSDEEIVKLRNHAKIRKAPGIDSVINECVKNEMARKVLKSLLNSRLKSSIIPSIWRKAITCLIPKCATSDPRVPLNYRGISLLSVISKLYTAGISIRITSYLETNHLISNKQNWF